MEKSRAGIIILVLVVSLAMVHSASASCEQHLTYTYTNNEPVLHRVTFAIIERSPDLSVAFSPAPFEVRPGETREFTVTGSSERSIANARVSFQIRKNAIPVGEYEAVFTLCDDIDGDRPVFSDDIPLYRIFVILGIIVVVFLGGMLVLGMDSPRKPRRTQSKEVTRRGIERTKIDVDTLVESYEVKPHEEPKLSKVLLILLVVFIVLVMGLILVLILTQNPTPLNTMPVSSLP
jgi:hypothetical protein